MVTMAVAVPPERFRWSLVTTTGAALARLCAAWCGVVALGSPEALALGAAIGTPAIFKTSCITGWAGTRRAIVGSPADCRKQLARVQDEFGVGHILTWFNAGGQVPNDQVQRSMRLSKV